MIIAILLCTCWVQAQQEFYYPWEIQQPVWKVTSLKNIPNHAKSASVTKTYTGKEGKKPNIYHSDYDISDGKVIGISEYNSKNKLSNHYQVYYQDSLIHRIERINAKGKIIRSYQLSSLNHYYTTIFYYSESKNGKVKKTIKSDYRQDGKKQYLVSRSVCRGKNEKVKNRWLYDYTSDFQLKTTTQFDGKGKVKHVWSHECKAEGEELYVSKDSTIVCKNTSTNANGDQVTVEIFSFAKNKTTKRIIVRDAENNFKSSQEFNSDGVLIRESEKISSINDRILWKNYDKEGKITISGISEFTKDGRMLYSEFTNHRKGAQTSKTYYEYYDDKSLKREKSELSDGSTINTEYKYNF